ncbi:MAG: outer membrane beta-barrel protein [Owenweeksia sp.]
MKRLNLLTLFFLIAGNLVRLNAQNFGGGMYLGMAGSQINGDFLAGYDQYGINAGFLTNVQWGKKSTAQLEIAFIQKGAREPNSDTSNFYRARLNYIEIPLLYIYRWGEFSFELGPALDILVTGQEETNGIEYDSSPPFHTLNLTGIFGINWHFSQKMHFNFRTNNSIIPIRDGNAPSTPSPYIQFGYGQRNIVLSFALVYVFSR